MRKIIAFIAITIMILDVFACSSKAKDTGKFRVVDGKELFYNGDEQIIDRLVTFEGEKYYIKEDGTKVKNDWAIIDNDGTYAYFGAKGIMVKASLWTINNNLFIFDNDGKYVNNGLTKFNNDTYYATKDGYLLRNQFKIIDGSDYYFDENGKQKIISTPSWVNNVNNNGLGDLQSGYYYLDEKGQRVKNTWVDKYYLQDTGLMATNKWIGTGESRVYVGADGKKETDYKEVVKLVKDILGTSNNTANKDIKETWKLDYYVDKFGDDTSEKYISGIFDGKFNNNIFKNQDCEFKFLIGKDYIDMMMFEYGTKQFENQIATLDVNIKNQYGLVLDCKGYFDMDRMSFDSAGTEFLLNALKNPGNIKILVDSDDVNINKYLVEIQSDNFATIYASLS